MSTWSTNLKIELLNTGDTNWGTLTNNNFQYALEQSITGLATATFATDANYDWGALYTNSNSSQGQRCLVVNVTSSVSLTSTRNFVVPTIQKQYIIYNNTTGSQSIVVKTSAGTGVTIPNGFRAHVYADGTNVVQMVNYFVSPTFLTPVLGTPSSGTLTSCTGLPVSTGISGLGTNVATALGNTANATGGFTTINGTATLTNKRIDPRVSSAASASSLTPDISSYDQYNFTALAAGLTINAPTGTPVDGNKLMFRILDNGTSRSLTWNATYTAIGVTLPSATTVSKTTYVGCVYNTNNTRWDVVAVTTQA